MQTTFEEFWWFTVVAVGLWGVVTFALCVCARRTTSAQKSMVIGVTMVLLAAIPPAAILSKLNQYKSDMAAEIGEEQAKLDDLSVDTQRKKCLHAISLGKACDAPKGTVNLAEFSVQLELLLDQLVSVVGLVLGLLGGALGVNVLSDGLLRKDPPPRTPTRRELHVKRTLGFKGGTLVQVTERTYRSPIDPSSDSTTT